MTDALQKFLFEDLPAIPAYANKGEIAVGCFSGSTGRPTLRWADFDSTRLVNGKADRPFKLLTDVKYAPELRATGETPIAAAINWAVEALDKRVAARVEERWSREFLPTIVLITDGEPTKGQDLDGVGRMLAARAFGANADFLFYALGVEQANDQIMERLAPGAYFPLRGMTMERLLKFVAASLGIVTGPVGGEPEQAAPLDMSPTRSYANRTEYARLRDYVNTFAGYE
ncbi:MAG: hypothetical protein M3Y77_10810 [Actinomycetota bacterium]|nr:hypothetical protein [Actinomycetota bacterium]